MNPDFRKVPFQPSVITDDEELFVEELQGIAGRLQERINVDEGSVEQGLVKLVLSLVELIRRLLERQAIRRMEGGGLTADQIEALGQALMQLEARMQELKDHFGLSDKDLDLNLRIEKGGGIGRIP